MNKAAHLSKRVKTAKGLRFCPVVTAANGRVKPDYVLVDGEPERHPEGAYYVSWYEGSRLRRISVGTDANSASARQHRQEQILAAKAHGLTVVEDTAKKNGRLLVNAAADYLHEIEQQKQPETYRSYRQAVQYFLQNCTKQTLEEIERKDLLNFIVYLRQTRELAPHTVHNKFSCVLSFLKRQGITGLVSKNDWPKYVADEPEVYEREDLNKFFAACNDEERILFEFFLMTGMREQEVIYASWSAVNFSRGTVTVRYNPEYGFSPKAYKEREIPIPNKLVESLEKWKSRKQASCDLLFPAKGCKPQSKTRFLYHCKKIARRAGLEPKGFWLHKFRATFATWHLWNVVDLRTVMLWMGHDDLASVMRYLKPNRSQVVREKVEKTFS